MMISTRSHRLLRTRLILRVGLIISRCLSISANIRTLISLSLIIIIILSLISSTNRSIRIRRDARLSSNNGMYVDIGLIASRSRCLVVSLNIRILRSIIRNHPSWCVPYK